MKNFLILYYATPEAMETMKDMTPEQQEADMKLWVEWMEKHQESMTDPWNPLGTTYKYSRSWVTRGDHKVLGYTIMKWEDIEGIYELLSTNPHLDWHEWATIEVSEVICM